MLTALIKLLNAFRNMLTIKPEKSGDMTMCYNVISCGMLTELVLNGKSIVHKLEN